MKNFQIPDYILVPESKADNIEISNYAPACPVLVFINSKSGGQLGGDLLKAYRTILNEKQVQTTTKKKRKKKEVEKQLSLVLGWIFPESASPLIILYMLDLVEMNSTIVNIQSQMCMATESGACNFQVFDLGEEAPDKVLRRIYGNFESLKQQGDQFAIRTMERLKLIVS